MARAGARDVILQIIRDADGEWSGKTRLYKAFYFAHLYYANERPGLLTDWPIARMPQGPGIHNGDALLGDLVREGYLTVEVFHEGPYPEYRYRLTEAGRQAGDLHGAVRWAIKEATIFCQGKTAAELSQITHERSRSWNQAKDGDILDVHIDTIPDGEYAEREREIMRLTDLLPTVLRDD